MLYLWGPGLDSAVGYRRKELAKSAGSRSSWLRRVRRAVAEAGRERPQPW
jgi:hypothetical protein